MIKPTFLPHHTLYNICYEFAIIFIILIFPPFSTQKTKKSSQKTHRYHSEGSEHPKQLPKITPPKAHSLHKNSSFPENRNTNFIKSKHFTKCNLCIFSCTLSCILRNRFTFILQKSRFSQKNHAKLKKNSSFLFAY